MSTISPKHLLFLILAALPFALSGAVIKRANATLSSGPALTASIWTTAIALSAGTPVPISNPPAATSIIAASPSVAVPSMPPSSNTSATLPPPPPTTPKSFGWLDDKGPEYGKVIIRNHCEYPLNMWSVGARRMKGVRNDTIGYAVPEDGFMYTIAPNTNYSEDYRITCPPALNGTWGYCWDHDKLRGQGISLKLSKNNTVASDILQLEYALVMNPLRGDTFNRFEYDVSLLDCGDPVWNKEAYGGAGRGVITDGDATTADHDIKLDSCPGYSGGLSVTFDPDPGPAVCPSIKCTGEKLCDQIYFFDRTRKSEPSMACTKEYKGNMVLDLCLQN